MAKLKIDKDKISRENAEKKGEIVHEDDTSYIVESDDTSAGTEVQNMNE